MASTYSTNLKIELIGTGEQSGTWGSTTNTNLGTALEQSIVGYGNPNFTSDADLTISLTDSNATQTARNLALNVTSSVSLTATRNLIVPTIQKPYIIRNNTTGSQSIVVKTSAGTGVTVPNGAYTVVYTDGTNVVSQITQLPSLTLATALAATSGGTGQSSYAVGDLLYASTTTALSKLADVATGNALISGGVSTAPAWGKIGLTTHVSGTLPVANGGTNQTTYTDGQLLIGNSTGNTLTKATLTAGTGITITNGSGAITIAGNTGTVTSVSGTGSVNGITLTGTVTSSGSLTLGGTLSGVSLTTQVTGTLPIANGGTGSTSTTYCSLTSNVTGTLPATNGGTDNSSYAVGDLLYASTTTALSKLAGVATGNALISGGVSTAPSWGKIGLTTHVSGTLPVANGGTGVTTSTGSGAVVLATSPTLTLTNATGLPLTTGVTGTLPVANGGTGATSLTANNVILGNGTSAVQVVAPSTSGNVLTSNGTTWASSAPMQLQYALYTSGTTTWTCPSGVTRIKVICIGGGGGGGSAYDDGDAWHNGGDGGRGGISIGIYTVIPGTGYSATVGAGGAGSNTAPNAGSAGGTSSLGSLLSATGGGGGAYGNTGASGSAGAGVSGVTANSSVNYGAGGAFVGNSGRTQAVSSSAAVTWTASLNLLPGAAGGGQTSGPAADVTGGVGGVVYIEYVG